MKKIFLALAAITLTLTASAQSYSNGDTVADFTVTDTHGNTYTLSEITAQGKWVVIDFFYYNCEACRETVPVFSELHQKYGCNSGDLFCISIDTGDDNSTVESFESQFSTQGGFSPAPAASGTQGGGDAVVNAFGIQAFPTYCLIDNNMVMKATDIWPIDVVANFETVFQTNGFSPTAMNCASAEVNEITLTSLNIFPNPTNGNFKIEVNAPANENLTVEVINSLGQAIYTQQEEIIEGNNSINVALENVSNGQYIVKLTTESGVITRKIQVSNK